MNNLKYSHLAEEWEQLNQRGWSLRKIAARFNTTHNTVAKTLKDSGIDYIVWKHHDFIDLTNRNFGLITVVKLIGKRPVGKSGKMDHVWECFCECNLEETFEVMGGNLRRKKGGKTHCGCSFPRKFDIIGRKFGALTVIKDSRKRDNGHVHWWCLCDCGKKTLQTYGSLSSGHTSSCGCGRLRGPEHPNWNGGNSEVKVYIRSQLKKWKQRSLEKYNYSCVISGVKGVFLEIHHLKKPFYLIFEEALQLCSLDPYPKVKDYQPNKFKKLVDTCVELHEKYEEGVPLTNKLHNEFHSIYGYDCTEKDFYEFKERKVIELKDAL
jgi:hypothetical protein